MHSCFKLRNVSKYLSLDEINRYWKTHITAWSLPQALAKVSSTFDPSGKFAYVANLASNTVSIYSIDASTGALTAGTAVSMGFDSDLRVATTGV